MELINTYRTTQPLTDRLKRRFVRDYSLPIALTDEPYFSYFMDLYDEAFDTKEKFSLFLHIVNKFQSEAEVLDYLKEITDSVFNDIKASPEYEEFIRADMNPYRVKSNYASTPIFKADNTGKELVSIDLSKANFQALNYYNPKIMNAESYRDLLLKYTSDEYILGSKYIRQIIFGNLNGGRIDTIEKYIIHQIVKELEPEGFTILSVTSDEIVLEGNQETYDKCVEITNRLPFDVAVELFVLKQLKYEHNQPCKSDRFFVKEFIAHTDEKRIPFEIKATDATFYPQLYKIVTNQPITEHDMAFRNEGFIATYKTPITGKLA